MNRVILKFRGEFFFLSNFYPCKVEYEGVVYPSVENAYQASKTAPHRRREFVDISPKEAKKRGKKVPLLQGWEGRKVEIMKELVWKKFSQNEELKEKLLETGNAILTEGNTWGDEFWGVNLRKKDESSPWSYKGKNMLGQILMEVREKLRNEEK
jgi:ribA/ribD-fused uncharacterized protein